MVRKGADMTERLIGDIRSAPDARAARELLIAADRIGIPHALLKTRLGAGAITGHAFNKELGRYRIEKQQPARSNTSIDLARTVLALHEKPVHDKRLDPVKWSNKKRTLRQADFNKLSREQSTVPDKLSTFISALACTQSQLIGQVHDSWESVGSRARTDTLHETARHALPSSLPEIEHPSATDFTNEVLSFGGEVPPIIKLSRSVFSLTASGLAVYHGRDNRAQPYHYRTTIEGTETIYLTLGPDEDPNDLADISDMAPLAIGEDTSLQAMLTPVASEVIATKQFDPFRRVEKQ